MQDREFDAVVFGCTGDTGALGCCWLYYHGKTLGIQSWAPAARNLGKVKTEIQDRLADKFPGDDGVAMADPIQADSSDYESLLAMCKRTRLVIACAGPYEKFGEGVIRACCEAGTHYVDVTGESWWVAQMEAKYSQQALEKNIALVSCAGYDSVPPDLSVWLAADALKAEGQELRRFDGFFSVGGGAMPSGTIETTWLGIESLKNAVYGCLCCGLCSKKKPAEPVDVEQPLTDKPKAQYVPESEQKNLSNNTFWNMMPNWSPLGRRFSVLHFMAPVNVNIVHRTAAQEGYGGLIYRERMALAAGCCPWLFGLVPTCISIFMVLLIVFLVLIPGCDGCVRRCLFGGNPPNILRVKEKMFAGCKRTGSISVTGYADSKTGKTRVETQLDSQYDAGLGFTMLSATTISGLIVQRTKGSEPVRVGFQTAVRCLGGKALMEGLKAMGVKIEVTVTK